MEWLRLVESISVFGSILIGVNVLFSGPGRLIKQLSVGLESTGLRGGSVALFKGIIKLKLADG